MRRDELHFDLPQELIAQEPVLPRDACRLMVLHRATRSAEHKTFTEIFSYLQAGDVLVFNNSKVLPARILAKRGSGGRVEILLLRDLGGGVWQCLMGGKADTGERLSCSKNLAATVITRPTASTPTATVQFNKSGAALVRAIETIGTMPTPPYIKKTLKDPALYQTVFAQDPGSAAAPTAGLHFTQELIDRIIQKGVQQEFVTLHVGLGTFQPIKTDHVEDHPIHSEWYSLEAQTLQRLRQAKQEGRRIVAVGTTSVRVLETVFSDPSLRSQSREISGETRIFIYPGYQFKAVDALITNFHTPHSSLLALVYAFAGQQFIRKAYDEAIQERYRFFSFGDAMFID